MPRDLNLQRGTKIFSVVLTAAMLILGAICWIVGLSIMFHK